MACSNLFDSLCSYLKTHFQNQKRMLPPLSIHLADHPPEGGQSARPSPQWESGCPGCIEPSVRRSPPLRARNGSWLELVSAHILMQGPANDQRRVLLLAGTGDGPRLVKELSRRHWRVSVSVVTATAAKAYAGLPVERISIGALQGVGGIKAALHQAGPFRWVVDATHPFAARISHDLVTACADLGQPLLRYERRLEPLGAASLLADADALAAQPLQGQRLLLAIGGRHLPALTAAVCRAGAIPYGRALPSPDGVRAALRA